MGCPPGGSLHSLCLRPALWRIAREGDQDPSPEGRGQLAQGAVCVCEGTRMPASPLQPAPVLEKKENLPGTYKCLSSFPALLTKVQSTSMAK